MLKLDELKDLLKKNNQSYKLAIKKYNNFYWATNGYFIIKIEPCEQKTFYYENFCDVDMCSHWTDKCENKPYDKINKCKYFHEATSEEECIAGFMPIEKILSKRKDHQKQLTLDGIYDENGFKYYLYYAGEEEVRLSLFYLNLFRNNFPPIKLFYENKFSPVFIESYNNMLCGCLMPLKWG